MDMEQRLKKIKSKAFWRVNIRPIVFEKEKIPTLSALQDLLEECIVRLRGWNYPYSRKNEISNGDDWIQLGCDWEQYIEFLRFYQSGQFIHYFALREDYNPHIQSEIPFPLTIPEPSGYVSIFSTLFTFTEIYEFAARLAQKDIFKTQVFISINLKGIYNYQLYTQRDRHLRKSYISNVNEINLEEPTLGVEELLAKRHEKAIDQTIKLFERFNWNESPRQVLVEEQKKLLERRF